MSSSPAPSVIRIAKACYLLAAMRGAYGFVHATMTGTTPGPVAGGFLFAMPVLLLAALIRPELMSLRSIRGLAAAAAVWQLPGLLLLKSWAPKVIANLTAQSFLGLSLVYLHTILCGIALLCLLTPVAGQFLARPTTGSTPRISETPN